MKIIRLIAVVSIAMLLSGCSNQNVGTAVGAASGTLIGSSISLIGAGAGLGVGSLVGVAVGTVFDNYANNNDLHNATNCRK